MQQGVGNNTKVGDQRRQQGHTNSKMQTREQPIFHLLQFSPPRFEKKKSLLKNTRGKTKRWRALRLLRIKTILCGSCYETISHEGNVKFAHIVAKHFHEYYTAVSKKGKMRILKAILYEIIDSGAQFLKKDTIRHYWYIVDVKVGKDKISHALRIMKRAKDIRERARVSQQKRPPSPNHNYGDVSELEAQQQATSLRQHQQATARASASIMSRVEAIILPRP